MSFIDLGAPGGTTAVGESASMLAGSCDEAVIVDPGSYAEWRKETAETAQGTGVIAVSSAVYVPRHLEPRTGGQGLQSPWQGRIPGGDDFGSLIASGGGSF